MTQKIKFQLYEMGTNKGLASSGGVVYVATAGLAKKLAITDSGGSSLTNPRALTRGGCEFYVADSINSLDLYIQCPNGQFLVRTGIVPGEFAFMLDTTNHHQTYIVPFDLTDTAAATETDTGFDLPLHAAVGPFPAIRIQTVDSGKTIDVGLLSSETAGDANGFVEAISLTTAGLVKATRTNGSKTSGVLISVQDSANSGDLTGEPHVVTGSNATSITYTLSSGSTTGKGFICMPLVLMALDTL